MQTMELRTETNAARETLNRPRFQYSLKTLLWMMTACAVLCAFAKWIGFPWCVGIAFSVAFVLTWTWIVHQLAMATLAPRRQDDLFTAITWSVTWAGVYYAVLVSSVIIAANVAGHLFESNIDSVATKLSGMFVAGVVMQVFLAIPFIAVGGAVFICTILVLAPIWGVGYLIERTIEQKDAGICAGIVGLIVGEALAVFVVSMQNWSPFWVALFMVGAGVTGLVVPPFLIRRSDRYWFRHVARHLPRERRN